jgi:hypothetical protein
MLSVNGKMDGTEILIFLKEHDSGGKMVNQ